jgi:hypothetical protein
VPAVPKKPGALVTKGGVNNIVSQRIKVCAMVLIFQKWRNHFLMRPDSPVDSYFEWPVAKLKTSFM